ncbi:DUF3368 domain-containing protein, partial [Candidatus Micrarchaeota archaeon]|nr:DUF3368 domain-containing protein [Candidatus Micrarchaeota archaeon]
KGELGAISLARELNAKLILLDDSSGRYIANKIFSLNVKGTIYILLLALEKGLLSRYHVRDNISTLVRKGFRLSIEFYSQLMRLIPPFDTEIEDHFIMHTFGEK